MPKPQQSNQTFRGGVGQVTIFATYTAVWYRKMTAFHQSTRLQDSDWLTVSTTKGTKLVMAQHRHIYTAEHIRWWCGWRCRIRELGYFLEMFAPAHWDYAHSCEGVSSHSLFSINRTSLNKAWLPRWIHRGLRLCGLTNWFGLINFQICL